MKSFKEDFWYQRAAPATHNSSSSSASWAHNAKGSAAVGLAFGMMVSFLLGVLEQPELEQAEGQDDAQPQPPFLSLQLYSEYRSTYKWHEFSSSPGARSSSATQQRSSTEVVVKKPPKPISGKQIKSCSLCSCYSHLALHIRQIAISSQILMATAFFGLDWPFWLRQKTKKTSWSFSRPLYFSTRSSTPYSRDCAGAPENLILTRFFLLHFPDDFHFTRKKKHPEIAHRSHEFFDPSLAPAFPTRASHNQYDSSRERVRNPFYCRASK